MDRRFSAAGWRLGLLIVIAVMSTVEAKVAKPVAKPAPVRLNVVVPEEGAALTVNDGETKGKGLKRQVEAIPIRTVRGFICTFSVVWDPNGYTTITRVRKLQVEPGKAYDVDLSQRDEKLDAKDEIVVRFVPTPDEIVDKMAELAKIGKDDVVFDLGCGDGRMVCRAVAKHGAKRGVGVDIDPERIEDSRLKAKEYKVTDQVAFRQGDVLKPISDLADATVIMLYMGDELGEQLSPILRKSLKPGTRVVSHRFFLGDWKPDKSIKVKDADEIDYDLHLWVVRGDKK